MSRAAAAQQLRRLLVMVPWLMERGGASIADLAARFGIDRPQVVRDVERAAMIGVPPYGPGELIDLYVEGDRVEAGPARVGFARPPRFTRDEGFALLVGAQALLALPGTDPGGPLARAVSKLASMLGDPARLVLDVEPPEHLALVQRAGREGRRLRIEYLSGWRDESSTREVDPWGVAFLAGRWQFAAFDHRSGEPRRFRVDRIRSAAETPQRFTPRPDAVPTAAFEPPPDARRVVLRLPAQARWVVETYPAEWEEEAGGRLRVTLVVAGTAWLERLLLRAGPEAEVLEPADLRGLAAAAAHRVLARYEGGGAPGRPPG